MFFLMKVAIQKNNNNLKFSLWFFSPNGVLRKGEEDYDISRENSYSDDDHKRKQPETETEVHTPDKAQASASGEGDGRSLSKGKNGPFQRKREKLDWSVLRPPKPQTKRGWG